MTELTQQQVIVYNKKVEEAKTKAANDKAKKELAEQELERLCAELSEQLGHPVTPETLEAEYAAFTAEAQKTIGSGMRILEGMQQEADAALQSATAVPVMPPKTATSANPVLAAAPKAVDGIDLDDLLGL